MFGKQSLRNIISRRTAKIIGRYTVRCWMFFIALWFHTLAIGTAQTADWKGWTGEILPGIKNTVFCLTRPFSILVWVSLVGLLEATSASRSCVEFENYVLLTDFNNAGGSQIYCFCMLFPQLFSQWWIHFDDSFFFDRSDFWGNMKFILT